MEALPKPLLALLVSFLGTYLLIQAHPIISHSTHSNLVSLPPSKYAAPERAENRTLEGEMRFYLVFLEVLHEGDSPDRVVALVPVQRIGLQAQRALQLVCT